MKRIPKRRKPVEMIRLIAHKKRQERQAAAALVRARDRLEWQVAITGGILAAGIYLVATVGL